MARLVCENCNYKLKTERDMSSKKCPYCGKGKLRKEESAEDLLNELCSVESESE
jgi:predicted RNA-binding Zn-ribbon protein involved in translation (DUF1610 family)